MPRLGESVSLFSDLWGVPRDVNLLEGLCTGIRLDGKVAEGWRLVESGACKALGFFGGGNGELCGNEGEKQLPGPVIEGRRVGHRAG